MIRVLHIFPPNIKFRFSGPVIRWRSYFKLWSIAGIKHYILDVKDKIILDAVDGLNFQPEIKSKNLSQIERGKWIYQLFFSLQKNKNRFDLIHVHVLWWGSLLIALWAKYRKIPCIYESVLLDADTPGSIKNESFGNLKIRLFKSFTGIVTISDYLNSEFINHGWPIEKVITLMNSVDSDLFQPVNSPSEKLKFRENFNLPLDAYILLFVGSVTYRKGVDILIEAFINSQKKASNLFLLIIGPKNCQENQSLDETYVEDQLDKLNSLNLQNHAKFLGNISDRKILAELYIASDVFVFPSRREGLGNVVLEAMASGLPVITSDLPVLEKVITDRQNCLTFPIGESGILSDLILTLINYPSLSQKISRSAREYILLHHSFAAWQERLSQYYQSLVHKT